MRRILFQRRKPARLAKEKEKKVFSSKMGNGFFFQLSRVYKTLLVLSILVMIGSSFGTVLPGRERPKIIIGDDYAYPPYSYQDQEGNPIGFNIDLAKATFDAVGYDVEFVQTDWNTAMENLESGKIDLISGMFFSVERSKTFSFSTSHSAGNGEIFSVKGKTLQSLEELSGKTVAIHRGDIVGEYLKTLDLDMKFVEYDTAADAILAVSEGEIEYAGVLKIPGHYYIKTFKVPNVVASDLKMPAGEYCMAVKKGNEGLIHLANAGLQILHENGTYNQIHDKWLTGYEALDIWKRLKKYIFFILAMGAVFLILFGWIFSLNKMVKKKTKSLEQKQKELFGANQELEAAMEELLATEEELRNQYDLALENEEKLRVSQERNQALVEAIPDLIFVLDEKGIFLDYQGDEKNLLIRPERFLGKNLDEVMPPKIAKESKEKLDLVFSQKILQIHNYSLIKDEKEYFYEARFVPSTKGEAFSIIRDVTKEMESKAYIEYLSYHDQLTGLYNRHFFEEELERLDHDRNYPLCLIMSDVNGLKLINDSFGHKMGDELLKKTAEVIKRACRASEIISRIGGDEFMILIPNMTEGEAEQLINRIQDFCKGEKVATLDLSISFGWAVKEEEGQTVQDVFNLAEDRMYKKKLFESPSMRGKTIQAIISTLHEKNEREAKHSERVSKYGMLFAEALHLSDVARDELKRAGLLHDIGKIAIHEGLLNKEGELTGEEYDEIKKHPEIGYRILSSVNDMADIAEIALHHHERWDGKGYPRGLKGDEIPQSSRIVAIVDAFDAMTGPRSYRAPMSQKEAAEEILRCAGTQFDPELAVLFVEKVLGFENVEENEEKLL